MACYQHLCNTDIETELYRCICKANIDWNILPDSCLCLLSSIFVFVVDYNHSNHSMEFNVVHGIMPKKMLDIILVLYHSAIFAGGLISANSHDSQIPMDIVASGSRDWEAEQKLTMIAHYKLSKGAADKSCVTWIWLSEHKHDWTATIDHATVQPMTTCWSHATGSPMHKALGDWSHMYKGHATSQFHEIMYRWKLWILFLSNILHQNCSIPTNPPSCHPKS